MKIFDYKIPFQVSSNIRATFNCDAPSETRPTDENKQLRKRQKMFLKKYF